jgi:hypothetical protein
LGGGWTGHSGVDWGVVSFMWAAYSSPTVFVLEHAAYRYSRSSDERSSTDDTPGTRMLALSPSQHGESLAPDGSHRHAIP